MRNKLIISAIVLLLGGLTFYFVARQPAAINTYTSAVSPSSTTSVPQAAPSGPVAPALKSQPGTVASITGIAMSTKIAASGAALAPKTTFATTDLTIYAVLLLKNTTRSTELAYIRYYNGKYVDSEVSHPTTNSARYFHFDWMLKPGQMRKAGTYTLNFYVNGRKTEGINYVVH